MTDQAEAWKNILEAADDAAASIDRLRRVAREGARVGDGDGTDRPEVPRSLARLHIPGLVHAPKEGDSGEWIGELKLPEGAVIRRIVARFTVVTGELGTLRDRPQHHLFQIGHPHWGEGSWNLWVKAGPGAGIIAGLTVSKGVRKGNLVKRINLPELPSRFEAIEIRQAAGVLSAARGAIVVGVGDDAVLPSTGPLKIQLGATLGVEDDKKVPSYGWEWHDLTVEVW